MSFQVSVRPAAETDIAKAATWYEEQENGLGADFIRAVTHAIDRIALNPFLAPRRHRRRDIRWVYPERFPYRIVYEIKDQSVLIIVVLHAARHDRGWLRRI